MLMTLIGITVTYASFSYLEEDSLSIIDKKYYIKVLEDADSKVLYEIEIAENGSFRVVEEYLSGTNESNSDKIEYDDKFSIEEFDSFRRTVLTINSLYPLNKNGHLFYYDYSKENSIGEKDKENILKLALTIRGYAKNEVTGREWLDLINDEFGNSNGNYKEIKFTDKKVKDELVQFGERQIRVRVEDKRVLIDENEVGIENYLNEVYLVDVDGDGTYELITRTYDLRISPPTNHYYIYKLNLDNTFTEILKISIMGSIDTFFVDGEKLMIKYESFEAKSGYVEVGNYTLK